MNNSVNAVAVAGDTWRGDLDCTRRQCQLMKLRARVASVYRLQLTHRLLICTKIIFCHVVVIIINVKIIVTLSQKKCCRGTVHNVMSKFAVNAVQQNDSAIMSGLQRMP